VPQSTSPAGLSSRSSLLERHDNMIHHSAAVQHANHTTLTKLKASWHHKTVRRKQSHASQNESLCFLTAVNASKSLTLSGNPATHDMKQRDHVHATGRAEARLPSEYVRATNTTQLIKKCTAGWLEQTIFAPNIATHIPRVLRMSGSCGRRNGLVASSSSSLAGTVHSPCMPHQPSCIKHHILATAGLQDDKAGTCDDRALLHNNATMILWHRGVTCSPLSASQPLYRHAPPAACCLGSLPAACKAGHCREKPCRHTHVQGGANPHKWYQLFALWKAEPCKTTTAIRTFAHLVLACVYSCAQKTHVCGGSAAILDSEDHICFGVPSNRRPQPIRNSVSPAGMHQMRIEGSTPACFTAGQQRHCGHMAHLGRRHWPAGRTA
jgi:hypothetical protein